MKGKNMMIESKISYFEKKGNINFNEVIKISVEAAIEKSIHPHTFRHSFATELMLAGAEIMVVKELMGHATVRSTEIYTHLNTKHLRETLLLYHPLYKKK